MARGQKNLRPAAAASSQRRAFGCQQGRKGVARQIGEFLLPPGGDGIEAGELSGGNADPTQIFLPVRQPSASPVAPSTPRSSVSPAPS